MKRTTAFGILLMLIPLFVGGTQEMRPVLTLAQCLERAKAQGNGPKLLQKNLDQVRSQYLQTVSKNSFSLNGTAGSNFAEAFGDTILLADLSGRTTGVKVVEKLAQTYQGGLTLAGPMTSLSLGALYFPNYLGDSSKTPTLLSLSLSQKIWDGYPGGTAKAAVDKSLINLHLTELSTEANALKLDYQVKQAYYTLLGAARGLKVKKENLERQKSALEQMAALYNIQQASAVDLQSAEINRKSAEIDLRSGENSYRVSRTSLANLIGLPADSNFSVTETEIPTLQARTLEEAIRTGLGQRIELKQIELGRRTAGIDLGLIKAQTSPTVSLIGSAYLLYDSEKSTQAKTLGAGVSIALPVYDAGSAKYQEETNLYQRETYDLQEDQYKRSIALDVETSYEAVEIQKERLELAKLTSENARAQYELKIIQRQYGTATNQDVLTASVTAVNAENDYAKARNDLELAILQLQNVMGF